MIKYTHFKLTPTQVLFSILGVGVVLTGLLFAVYQLKYGNFGLVSKASDPCASYTKQKPVGESSGVVVSKSETSFVWNLNGDATKPKVVMVCAGTIITRQVGGSMTYADLQVGDKVDLMGWYGDTTKNTVLPKWIRDTSTSQAREFTSRVLSVNGSGSSFVLSAVDLAIAGVKGSYNLNVKYTPTTLCSRVMTANTQDPIPCSGIAVGQNAAVSGVLDDKSLTLTATKVIVVSNPKIDCQSLTTLVDCDATGDYCSWYVCVNKCLAAGTTGVCP